MGPSKLPCACHGQAWCMLRMIGACQLQYCGPPKRMAGTLECHNREGMLTCNIMATPKSAAAKDGASLMPMCTAETCHRLLRHKFAACQLVPTHNMLLHPKASLGHASAHCQKPYSRKLPVISGCICIFNIEDACAC